MRGIKKLSNVCYHSHKNNNKCGTLLYLLSKISKVWKNLTIPLQEPSKFLLLSLSHLKSNLKRKLDLVQ